MCMSWVGFIFFVLEGGLNILSLVSAFVLIVKSLFMSIYEYLVDSHDSTYLIY